MSIEGLYAGLCASCLFFAAMFTAVSVALTVWPLICRVYRKMRRAGALDKVVALVVIGIAVAYGGSKFTPGSGNAGSDSGINLVKIEAEYDSTNDVTAIKVSFVGNNVGLLTPVFVRNTQTEPWRELEKLDAIITSDLPTNVLSFAVSGNAETNRFWWVGVDTPAVIIETTGIEITYFAASSRFVQIAWTCDDPKATEFTIQRRRRGGQWETVGVTSSLAFIYAGFTVGETWEWRVSSTYTEGEE